MFCKGLGIALLSLLVGFVPFGWSRTEIAQNSNPATHNVLPPSVTPPPSNVQKTDPDRLPSDVDELVCRALKTEYDRCDPVCGQRCEALYGEARECPNVGRRCVK
jgi:hypothetical protein